MRARMEHGALLPSPRARAVILRRLCRAAFLANECQARAATKDAHRSSARRMTRHGMLAKPRCLGEIRAARHALSCHVAMSPRALAPARMTAPAPVAATGGAGGYPLSDAPTPGETPRASGLAQPVRRRLPCAADRSRACRVSAQKWRVATRQVACHLLRRPTRQCHVLSCATTRQAARAWRASARDRRVVSSICDPGVEPSVRPAVWRAESCEHSHRSALQLRPAERPARLTRLVTCHLRGLLARQVASSRLGWRVACRSTLSCWHHAPFEPVLQGR